MCVLIPEGLKCSTDRRTRTSTERDGARLVQVSQVDIGGHGILFDDFPVRDGGEVYSGFIKCDGGFQCGTAKTSV